MAAIDVPSETPPPHFRTEIGGPPAPMPPVRDKVDVSVLTVELIGAALVVGLGWLVKRRLDASARN